MFRFWFWKPQDLNLLIAEVEPYSEAQDRLLELIECYNLLQDTSNSQTWLHYRKDEEPN